MFTKNKQVLCDYSTEYADYEFSGTVLENHDVKQELTNIYNSQKGEARSWCYLASLLFIILLYIYFNS